MHLGATKDSYSKSGFRSGTISGQHTFTVSGVENTRWLKLLMNPAKVPLQIYEVSVMGYPACK
ncbi:hypothetical protein DPMN_104556 [Dreissena polymorpha]|uniref:Uncharacterized protein n=1 Tax=Dreissena polymorpha TaxID=45954 RepID=A0A9D4HA06_DREPO|nr:hypothetical protein DPMN_104556 [Dreissena polymorpha]